MRPHVTMENKWTAPHRTSKGALHCIGHAHVLSVVLLTWAQAFRGITMLGVLSHPFGRWEVMALEDITSNMASTKPGGIFPVTTR